MRSRVMNNQNNLDLSGVPKELNIICEFIKRDHEESIASIGKGWFEGIDWNLFYKLAIHHRMYPLLYTKTKDSRDIPQTVVKALTQEYKRNTIRMLQLSGEMDQVSKLFADNQIHLIVLKGPVLGHDLYGDISLRTCGDLDVLVPIESLNQVDQLLVEQGYIKDDYIETVLGDWKWRHHHVTYFHESKPIKLEIHWRLNPGPGKEPSFQELWQRKRVSSLTSEPVYYLGREDLFLFLVTHGARHGWSRLRWLTDIKQLMEQDIDWPTLNRLFQRYHCTHLAGQAIILVSQMLGARVTKHMKPLIAGTRPYQLAQDTLFYFKSLVNLHTSPIPEEVARYHKRHLFSLMSSQQKLLFLLSTFYPYPEDAVTLPMPKPLHILYFPLRPFLVVWRKTRKKSAIKV